MRSNHRIHGRADTRRSLLAVLTGRSRRPSAPSAPGGPSAFQLTWVSLLLHSFCGESPIATSFRSPFSLRHPV